MTELSVTLREYLSKMGLRLDSDLLREGMAVLARLLMEWEASPDLRRSPRYCSPPTGTPP